VIDCGEWPSAGYTEIPSGSTGVMEAASTLAGICGFLPHKLANSFLDSIRDCAYGAIMPSGCRNAALSSHLEDGPA
jgi:hypothetical protein